MIAARGLRMMAAVLGSLRRTSEEADDAAPGRFDAAAATAVLETPSLRTLEVTGRSARPLPRGGAVHFGGAGLSHTATEPQPPLPPLLPSPGTCV